MNSNELKAAMKRNGDTQAKLARFLGLQTSGVNARINGDIEFRASEISKIMKRYNLSLKETNLIFFTKQASK